MIGSIVPAVNAAPLPGSKSREAAIKTPRRGACWWNSELSSASVSSSDERLSVEPPARHRFKGIQLRVGRQESLPLTHQQKAEGMLCNMGAVVFGKQHAGRAGGTVGRTVREGQSSPAHRTTGSDSTTGTNWGVGGWREACFFFFTWRSTLFFLSFISSCILLSRRSSREEDRKVVHAFRASPPLPPQSVLVWYSSWLCL